MDFSLEFLVYAGALVATGAVGGVCAIGLIVWLAGGKSRNSSETKE